MEESGRAHALAARAGSEEASGEGKRDDPGGGVLGEGKRGKHRKGTGSGGGSRREGSGGDVGGGGGELPGVCDH